MRTCNRIRIRRAVLKCPIPGSRVCWNVDRLFARAPLRRRIIFWVVRTYIVPLNRCTHNPYPTLHSDLTSGSSPLHTELLLCDFSTSIGNLIKFHSRTKVRWHFWNAVCQFKNFFHSFRRAKMSLAAHRVRRCICESELIPHIARGSPALKSYIQSRRAIRSSR